MATNKDTQSESHLTEFKTTITLFQKKRVLTFYRNQNSVPKAKCQYNASFQLRGFVPECRVALFCKISEGDQKFLEEEGDSINVLNDGYGLFVKVGLSLLSGSRIVFDMDYEKEQIDPESLEMPEKDFRNWPENMVTSLWSLDVFQKSVLENGRVLGNSEFVRIFETLDWHQKENVISNDKLQKNEWPMIFKTLLTFFEQSCNMGWSYGQSFEKIDNCWILPGGGVVPTDVPVKTLASFCLTTGRFPNLEEVNMLRGNTKERAGN